MIQCPACHFDSPDEAEWCDFCKEPFRKKAAKAAEAAPPAETPTQALEAGSPPPVDPASSVPTNPAVTPDAAAPLEITDALGAAPEAAQPVAQPTEPVTQPQPAAVVSPPAQPKSAPLPMDPRQIEIMLAADRTADDIPKIPESTRLIAFGFLALILFAGAMAGMYLLMHRGGGNGPQPPAPMNVPNNQPVPVPLPVNNPQPQPEQPPANIPNNQPGTPNPQPEQPPVNNPQPQPEQPPVSNPSAN